MPHAKKRQLSSPARRHLLAVGAASATKAAAALTVVSGILRPSEARGDHDHDVHCFIEGTRVRTPHGNVRVDDLQIGDLVVTMHGGALPVKWIGRYVYEKS